MIDYLLSNLCCIDSSWATLFLENLNFAVDGARRMIMLKGIVQKRWVVENRVNSTFAGHWSWVFTLQASFFSFDLSTVSLNPWRIRRYLFLSADERVKVDMLVILLCFRTSFIPLVVFSLRKSDQFVTRTLFPSLKIQSGKPSYPMLADPPIIEDHPYQKTRVFYGG